MRTITTIKLQKSTNYNLKAKLIEAYKNMSKKELQLLQEWDMASNEVEYYG